MSVSSINQPMDSNNQADDHSPPQMEGGDWRSNLQPESRQKVVNKIIETLKVHLPYSGEEGLQQLKLIATRFEEKIYSISTSQSDYLRKISLKMLTMESRSEGALPSGLPSNPDGVTTTLQDSASSAI